MAIPRLNSRISVALLVVSAGCMPAFGAAGQKPSPARKHPAAAATPQAATPVPATQPEENKTLAQKPAMPPQVTYLGGQLQIIAQNSTMGDILRAVRSKTGATIEMPADDTERVVTNLGPGPARQVLASLLDGSNLNYVMVGSPADPQSVQHVVLTVKPQGAAPSAPNNPAYAQAPEPPPASDTDSAEDTGEAETPTTDAPGDADQGGSAPAVDQPQAESQDGEQQPAIRTPEQMLRELQRQQQEQMQKQQGETGIPQPPNNSNQPQPFVNQVPRPFDNPPPGNQPEQAPQDPPQQ